MAVKDVFEYVVQAERRWRQIGITAEPIGEHPVFEYISRQGRPPFSVGHHLVRLTFGVENAYMKVDEWLVGESNRIRRETYVYELIHEGGILEEWHRHRHADDHMHVQSVTGERVRVQRASTSLKRAERIAIDQLWRGPLPN